MSRPVGRLVLVSAVVALTAALGQGGAVAAVPDPIDRSQLPKDGNPAPQPKTKQREACARAVTGGEGPDIPTAQRALGFDSVWPITRGAGQTVAVIDTGVMPHARLPNLSPGGDYVATGNGITEDCDVHGTIVAGIIGAQPVAGSGFSGAAPDVRIISIRQSSAAYAVDGRQDENSAVENSPGVGNVETLAMAIRHAADMNATVINISEVACKFAGAGIKDGMLGAAVQYAAKDQDVVVVAAAGNLKSGGCDNQNPSLEPLEPGSDPWDSILTIATPAWYDDYVLTVGSVDDDGRPSDFSLFGPWVDVAAPGRGIVSLHPDGTHLSNAKSDSKGVTAPHTGTSFAAPYVSATAALVRSRFPHLKAHEVIARIEATAHAPAEGWNTAVGHGIIDPLAAVTADVPLEGLPDDQPHSVAIAAPPAPIPPNDRPRNVALASVGAIGALLTLGVLGSFPFRRRIRMMADQRGS